MILIKRYSNRKLYNTAEKEYINLQDIGSLIQSGVEVQVIENTTGEDITAFTLSTSFSRLGHRPSPPGPVTSMIVPVAVK